MDGERGRVKALALWVGNHRPMREIEERRVLAGGALEGEERRASGKRGITLMSEMDWTKACAELGRTLPWHTRRANVLVEGMALASTIGRRIRIGEVEIKVWGETKPCKLMDELCAGLKEALVPDCRGGVHGEILNDGVIRRGDGISCVD